MSLSCLLVYQMWHSAYTLFVRRKLGKWVGYWWTKDLLGQPCGTGKQSNWNIAPLIWIGFKNFNFDFKFMLKIISNTIWVWTSCQLGVILILVWLKVDLPFIWVQLWIRPNFNLGRTRMVAQLCIMSNIDLDQTLIWCNFDLGQSLILGRDQFWFELYFILV